MRVIGLLLIFAVSIQANAAVKICRGWNSKPETRGQIFEASVSERELQIRAIETDFSPGKYPLKEGVVTGRDKKVYLQFQGDRVDDVRFVYLVDIELLKSGTTGLLKLRARGEGFENYIFVCSDK